ncbi:macrophage mannose receptor 1-like [Haliotis rufescens]|uniref:macrophage mannose receptor 1-like n=1 Tax=Haliotis rufescens TaxID=6454 RepID=UPI00201EC299|nr:macrophage mannose receptor 1-like [Haliotis rufescens]
MGTCLNSLLASVCLVLVYTALPVTSSNSQNVDISCRNGWLKADNSCYYWTVADQVTWADARRECQSRRADLMVINSAKEQDWVNVQTQEENTDGWWVGLSYSVDDVQWEWLDTTVDISNIQWNLEPDNYENEDCCAINEYGKFSDDACREHYGYICKVPRTKDEACPTPATDGRWSFLDYACYFISDPSDTSDRLTWTDARTKCQGLKPTGVAANMDLVSIVTADESRFFNEKLGDLSNAGMAVKWWTGLNDQQAESIYKWSDGSAWNSSYTPWDYAPSTDRSEDQSCGLMYTGGVVDDTKCSARAGYICETSAVHKWTPLGCSAHWIRGGQHCYRFQNRTQVTWTAARKNCQHDGGDLLKIDNVDEKYWFDHMYLAGGRGYWTGLNDQAQEGDFVWADGSAPDNTLVQWDSEPDNAHNQDCTVIMSDGSFSDQSCASRAGYVCKYTKDPGEQCATGWATYQQAGCYYISSGNRSRGVMWDEVKQRCLDLAHIYDNELQAFYLYIQSQAEMTWLVSQLQLQPDLGMMWWTGLNDITIEGAWTWATDFANPVDMTLIPWDTEPNNYGGNEDCAVMLPGGRYNDMPCTAKSYYICKSAAGLGVVVSSMVMWAGVLATLLAR